MMQPLLQRLVFDVPHLTDYCKIPLKVDTHISVYYSIYETILLHQFKMINLLTLVNTFLYQLLTSHYEQRWKYYSRTGGQGDQGLATEEELHLSRKLFWGVFKALAKKVNHIEYMKH